jgi:citronellol/citronellal dehydrogenase
MNVAKDEEIEAMARRTLTEFGRIDILVNNAAVSAPGSFLEVPPKHWDLVMNVNVRGVYLCTKAFLPTMVDQRSGCIINISSYASQVVGDWGLAYSVSKAALERMTTGLAAELRSYDIAVNALQIERFVASEGFVYLTPGANHSTWDDPKLVGEAVLWMIRHDPTYTGQVVTLGDIDSQRAQD